LYDNHFRDDEIARIAAAQDRIVLTRDRELLKRRDITHGCYVRALHSVPQLHEVFDRLDLARSARPFTRCLNCNAMLHPVAKAQVVSQLPPGVHERHERFVACEGCGRVYWEGSHWRRMRERIEALLAPSQP
ncbi:MAG TPA: Mut7-C RNAse domain-containing protein, partial [Burkholderiaceae bacterium]